MIFVLHFEQRANIRVALESETSIARPSSGLLGSDAYQRLHHSLRIPVLARKFVIPRHLHAEVFAWPHQR